VADEIGTPLAIGAILLLIGGTVVATLVIFRPAQARLSAVEEAARRFGEGDLSARAPEMGGDEVAAVATAFNRMASDLAARQAQLVEADRARRQLLADVSHELMTPLTAIRGYAEGLGEGALPAEEAASTIVTESRRLERLVGDLLDLARMRKAEFSVRREPIDLRAIAQEALRRYEVQAREFGVTLEADGAAAAPATGDADRTLQIVSNLVENALRLTPAGGSVRIVTAPGSIRVEDTGPGLEPEELGQAFERFYLYSRYGRERSVGTGLGLAIVKELAEGMGGSVAAESTPGELTVFTVLLPHAVAARPLTHA
jgi:two-component system, OmpR family, sensor kinase